MLLDLARKFARPTRAEWVEALRAQSALIRAQLTVWTRGQGRLVGASAPGARPIAPDISRAAELAAVRMGLAVDRAARYGVFRPQCLVRAVALLQMMESRGFDGARIRIGVRPHAGRLLAHAWIEYGRLVLGDRPEHTERFQPLEGLDLFRGEASRWH